MATSDRIVYRSCRAGAVAAVVLTLFAFVPPAACAAGSRYRNRRAASRSGSFVGKASYYAPRLRGRRTATGDRYNPSADTAATSRLPLGSRAHVTNLRNGKAVNVTVTDRGRRVRGRRIDLSKHAATEIGITRREGIAPVKVDPQPGPAISETSGR